MKKLALSLMVLLSQSCGFIPSLDCYKVGSLDIEGDSGFMQTTFGCRSVYHKKQAPLYVYIDSSIGEEYEKSIKESVKIINQFIGCNILQKPTREQVSRIDRDFTIEIEEGLTGGAYAHTVYSGFNGVVKDTSVRLPLELQGSEYSTHVIVHEILHGLGLDHDNDNKQSVMYPYLEQVGFSLTYHDADILYDHYCTN